MPIQPVPAILFDGMEKGVKDWHLTGIAAITQDPSLVLNGAASLLISNSAPGFAVAVMNNPENFPILRRHGIQRIDLGPGGRQQRPAVERT